MTAVIAVPTEPAELLAPVAAPAAKGAPATGFDLLIALLQANLASATPADGAQNAATTLASAITVPGTPTPAADAEATVETPAASILAALTATPRRASTSDDAVDAIAVPVRDPREEERSTTASPLAAALAASVSMTIPTTPAPAAAPVPPAPVDGTAPFGAPAADAPAAMPAAAFERPTAPARPGDEVIARERTDAAAPARATAEGAPAFQPLMRALAPEATGEAANVTGTDAAVEPDVETTIVAAAPEMRPRPALAPRGADTLRRVSAGIGVPQDARGDETVSALRGPGPRRTPELGEVRELFAGVHGRASAESGEAPATRDADAAIGGIVAPGASATSRASVETSEGARSAPARDAVDQIAIRLREVRTPGRHELSVRLDPPDLGTVRIDARLEGATLHLQIRAEHAPTGEMLADAIPRLRESLVQQGFAPADVSVQLGLENSGRQSTRDGAPAFTPPATEGDRLPAPPTVRAATARAVAVTDGLDVWA